MPTWVKFRTPGAPHGYAYLMGDVVELSDADVEKCYKSECAIPATPAEIEAAKKKLEASQVSEKSVSAAHYSADTVARMVERLSALEAQVLVAGGGDKKSKSGKLADAPPAENPA